MVCLVVAARGKRS